jgi:hypothetical protein
MTIKAMKEKKQILWDVLVLKWGTERQLLERIALWKTPDGTHFPESILEYNTTFLDLFP